MLLELRVIEAAARRCQATPGIFRRFPDDPNDFAALLRSIFMDKLGGISPENFAFPLRFIADEFGNLTLEERREVVQKFNGFNQRWWDRKPKLIENQPKPDCLVLTSEGVRRRLRTVRTRVPCKYSCSYYVVVS